MGISLTLHTMLLCVWALWLKLLVSLMNDDGDNHR